MKIKRRRVDLQLSATFHLPRGYQPSANLTQEAIAYRLEHGDDHPSVSIRIVGWNTSTGQHGSPAGSADEEKAWERFKKLIEHAEITITTGDH